MSDISEIRPDLFIAAHPQPEDVEAIRTLGVSLILNMIWHRPTSALTRPPFRMITLRTFDSPHIPIPMGALRKGVEAALAAIANGERVLVYCREGRHRSVAMTACILIGLGYSADQAMTLITSRRAVADPHAPHIERRIRSFETLWLTKKEEQ